MCKPQELIGYQVEFNNRVKAMQDAPDGMRAIRFRDVQNFVMDVIATAQTKSSREGMALAAELSKKANLYDAMRTCQRNLERYQR